MKRRIAVGLLLAGALLLSPAGYAAARTHVHVFRHPSGEGVLVTGTDGDDHIRIAQDRGWGYRVWDPSGVVAGRRCEPRGEDRAYCSPWDWGTLRIEGLGGDDSIHADQQFADDLLVHLGDGDDRFRLTDCCLDLYLVLNGKLRGGRGDDNIKAESGKNKFFGGAGRDVMFGWILRDLVIGGTGADVLNGGRGNDRIRAADRAEDAKLSCGPKDDERGDRDYAVIDRIDPRPSGCATYAVVGRDRR